MAVLCAVPGWATSLLIVPRTEAARLTCENLVEVFTAQKLTVKMAGPKSAAVACLGKPAAQRPACFLDATTKSRVDGVVLISSAKRGAQVTVTMELLSRATGKVHATQKVRAPAKALKAKANVPVQRLVVEMLVEDAPARGQPGAPVVALEDGDEELAPLGVVAVKQPEPPPEVLAPPEDAKPVAPEPPPKPVVADAPKTVTLTPPVKDTPVVVAPGPSKGTNVPAIAVTGVAVAAAAAAAVFGGMAMASKAQLESAPNGISPLTYEEAVALQSRTNTHFTIALGAGIGAGVSAGVAAYLWAAQ